MVVMRDTGANTLLIEVEQGLADLFHDGSIAIVAIDIPIGLLDAAVPGGRDCDKLARSFLGPRRNSVFSPPVRPMLGASGYEDAKERSRSSSPHGIALSKQCYATREKIVEVDQLMTPELQGHVVEVHPEVSFTAMNGGALRRSARRAEEVEGRARASGGTAARCLGHRC